MNKKLLIPMTILATLAVAGTVEAHNATATPSCSGLSWSATNFAREVVNSIVVKVDGATVHQDLDFKSSDDGTSPWSQTAPHTWSVVINAPGTEFDRSFGGTWQACQTAPTTTVAASSTTVVVTTTPATTGLPVTTTVVTTTPEAPTTVPATCDTTGTVASCFPPVPTTVALDVISLTPVEPVLPRTGLDGTIIAFATGFLIVGAFLVIRGRRVP